MNTDMNVNYKCRRCDYKTDKFFDMKKHILKKKICCKTCDAIPFSDDQLFIETLLPYIDNVNMIDEIEMITLEKSNLLYKNRELILSLIDKINKCRIKNCEYCNLECKDTFDLRKHLLLNCYYNKLKRASLEKENTIINNVSVENITINNNTNNNNTTANNTVNGNNNNLINLFFEIKSPVPFDDDWDISHISPEKRAKIFISSMMYKKLLEEILKNELNLNVIIDSDSKSGMVYKNAIEKYINMNQIDIMNSTMDKLNKYLIIFNKTEKDEGTMKEIIDYTRRIINQQHINYGKDTELQESFGKILGGVFEEKRDEAVDIFTNITDKEKKDKLNAIV